MIDNRDPRRPKQGNSKGARLEEERNNQIMHENTILLNKLSKILTREPDVIREPMLVRGLNENHKKGERERIDRENQALLRRLQDVRSSIDGEAAREQYALHEHLLQNHANSFVANPFLGVSFDASSSAVSRPRSGVSARSRSAGGRSRGMDDSGMEVPAVTGVSSTGLKTLGETPAPESATSS